MKQYDVVIVGGGPGGYVAALRAAKYNKSVALVENDYMGGTCLNRGCIPSKTLLNQSGILDTINSASQWDINVENVTYSFDSMRKRKDEVIGTLRKGISHLLKKNKIEVYDGLGKIEEDKIVKVTKQEKTTSIKGEKIIIATGSSPLIPPIEGLNDIDYLTTDTIFDIEKVPESIVIVGGGVIGVEMATIFTNLGSKVTIIEMGKRIVGTEDKDISSVLMQHLKGKGVEVLCGRSAGSISRKNGFIEVATASQSGGESIVSAEAILIAVGRKPNLSAISKVDVKQDKGFIKVDDFLETSVKGIFAIGDVIGRLQLAHVATREGLTAVENLDQLQKKMEYKSMPRCIYTNPEVASAGKTEEDLKKENVAYEVNKQFLSGNGRALTMDAPEGFIKVLIDKKYGEILGVTMVGSSVTEIIGQASAYMQLEGTVDEWAELTQPHPSISEGLMEAANSLIGKGIHA